ncbi:MAG: helix-turn-helix domain-containing protein [Bacillota bacterium]|jgi:Mn-dependent DtxR family transcriptional regulator
MTSQRIESLAKALTILNLFKFNKPEWGVTEIARELGMQKSTVFRLLATLQEFGFVRRAKIGVTGWESACLNWAMWWQLPLIYGILL